MKTALEYYLSMIFLLLCVQGVYGQVLENRLERFQAQKIAFFTDRLQLTPAEAEKFWPVYNDYNSRKDRLDEETRSLMRYVMRNADNMSAKEINDSMGKYLQLQEQGHQLFLEYHKKYLEILPPEKVLKIYITETQFKTVLLNQIRENRPLRAPGR